MTTTEGALRLPDWGLLRAQGADAAAFLHNQLTQDITGLTAPQVRLAGYCSAKGRLLASFIAWRPQPETVLLACSADLLPATLKRLGMFVLRAKCSLSDASAELPLWGLAGEAALAWLGDAAPPAPWQHREHAGGQLLRLPDVDGTARLLWAAPPAAQPPLPALAADAWAALEVRSGVPRITAATSEQFVPQMVNLELLDGVNFRKGCYPGQEVVARSQYRGTLKRRMTLWQAEAAAQPGDELFHSEDPSQPAGLVVQAAGTLLLASVKTAGLDQGSWHLRAADGPLLAALPLPYPVPLPADTPA